MSEAVDHWLSTLVSPEEVERTGPEPGWLGARRAEALGRFRKRGFPTRREEAWKYTNPERITSIAYRPAPIAGIEALPLVSCDGPRAVFVNGRFRAALSTLASIPGGLSCKTVGATSDFPDDALAVDPSLEDRPFAALADAFFEDGLFSKAKRGARSESPSTRSL